MASSAFHVIRRKGGKNPANGFRRFFRVVGEREDGGVFAEDDVALLPVLVGLFGSAADNGLRQMLQAPLACASKRVETL
ncbi:MAG: hypothetical protein IJ678_04615, partial [Kiritimatiellae bacterium]|nr:hypothetical protein [Kiritimatiellia bacterium]